MGIRGEKSSKGKRTLGQNPTRGFRIFSASAGKIGGDLVGIIQLLGYRFGIDGDQGKIIVKQESRIKYLGRLQLK
jgi:hypothetical protein